MLIKTYVTGPARLYQFVCYTIYSKWAAISPPKVTTTVCLCFCLHLVLFYALNIIVILKYKILLNKKLIITIKLLSVAEKLGCSEPEYDEFSFFTPDGTVKSDDLVATDTGFVARRDSLLLAASASSTAVTEKQPEDRKRALTEPHRKHNWLRIAKFSCTI